MKVGVAVLGSQSLKIVFMVSVDVKRHRERRQCFRAQDSNCVKVEVAVLGSSSLRVLMVYVDAKQH